MGKGNEEDKKIQITQIWKARILSEKFFLLSPSKESWIHSRYWKWTPTTALCQRPGIRPWVQDHQGSCLITNGQSQTSLSLDNLSKFRSKTNAECQELCCERELSFHTNFLFCFCFLNNTPLLTFWFVKFFFLKLFNELFHCETGKSSDTETHRARQVQTTQWECKAAL